MQCVEILQGSVCFRAKQLIQAEKDKAEDLKFDYDEVKNTSFLTGIFCALHTLKTMGHEVAAKSIIENNTSLEEMRSYAMRHGSEADMDVFLWANKL